MLEFKMEQINRKKEEVVNLVEDNYILKEDVGKIVNDAVNLAMKI